ncbi:MAG: DUF3558 family protein [Pseudonocardiales bacterium]
MSIRICLAPLVLILAAAGCSVPEAGTPAGQPGPSGPPPSQASPPPSTNSPSPTRLAAIEACELLSAQEVSSLGVPSQGRPEEVLGLRRCDWGGPDGGGISTGINEELGIDGLNLTDASSVTDITIGRHRAKRAVEGSGPGYCDIIFAVGDSANVSVLALYLNDTPRACSVADQAAALIEPKLP